tara:strand:+ start:241 stop:462 length:222 start_codon:yes stop_codon:yes gene_type:complete
MEKKKLNRIINIIREEMMTTGSTPSAAGFSSKADAKGPTAGFDPVMGKMMKRRKKYLSLGVGSRKRWMKKNES